MIAVTLNDAQARGVIDAWHLERRMLFPDQYVVTDRHGTVRWSRQGIESYCVGLHIGMGFIPDPTNNDKEASYPCFDAE